MERLNDAQQQAAHAGNGPLVIIAGPGTGKTKTLVARIQFLVAQGVPASRVLALTFTKKAAGELQERLGNSGAHVATFHSLCFELLAELRGDPPQCITESARLALIKQVPKPAVLKGSTARELSLLISRTKNKAEDSPAARRLLAQYQAELQARNLYDFDDLLVRLRDELQTDPAARTAVRGRYDHILVDEFQDTNLLQYELLQLIRGTNNMCVIGDPLQSIYGFRGADGDIFARFNADFADARHCTLTTNYRSVPQIVQAANAVYPDAPRLQAYHTAPGAVQAVEVLNEYSEAAWVLDSIQKAIGGSDLQRAVSDDTRHTRRSLSDFAVLYRSRVVARTLQKMFADSGVPFQIVGDGSPYDEPTTQTIIQLLGRLVNLERPFAVKDVSTAQADELLRPYTASDAPLATAERLAAACGFITDTPLRQLYSTLVQFTTTFQAVAYFDDIAGQDFYDPRAEAVTLLTIHAAKGLEFTHVFLLAAEDGVLPSTRGDTTEEQRLFYVALTRAKNQLDVLHARFRGGQKTVVSPFVVTLPAHILPRKHDPALATDQRRAVKRQAKRAQTSLF